MGCAFRALAKLAPCGAIYIIWPPPPPPLALSKQHVGGRRRKRRHSDSRPVCAGRRRHLSGGGGGCGASLAQIWLRARSRRPRPDCGSAGAPKAPIRLTVVGATVEFEPEAHSAQVLAVGQDSDHICAHNWRRKLVPHRAVCVLVRAQQLPVPVGSVWETRCESFELVCLRYFLGLGETSLGQI